eukprot:gene11212-23427_t
MSPSESVGIATIVASWNPVLWAAVAGSVRAWCASHGVPFVCPPEEFRCKILDSTKPGHASSISRWESSQYGHFNTGSVSVAAASHGWWGVSLMDLPGDQLRREVMKQTIERPTLVLMPPQQDCLLRLRMWYQENPLPTTTTTTSSSSSSKGNNVGSDASSTSSSNTNPNANTEYTLPDMMSDKSVVYRLCQQQSLCANTLGAVCKSQENASRAVEIIRTQLAPEAVLLMPLSVFDSAVNSLFGRLATVTKPASNFPAEYVKNTQIDDGEEAIPEPRAFSLNTVRQSSLPVAEALLAVEEANAYMRAMGDLKEDNPITKALDLEEVMRWDIAMHTALRELAMRGQLGVNK